MKGPKFTPEKATNGFDDESQEIDELKGDTEFNPNDVLNAGSKKAKGKTQEDDDFNNEVKVNFSRGMKDTLKQIFN